MSTKMSEFSGDWAEPILPKEDTLEKKKDFEPQGKIDKIYSLSVPNMESDAQHAIAKTVIQLGRTLLDKNSRYGNSALNPVRVHSSANLFEQLNVRADDKLSRLRAAKGKDEEDALMDYTGYLILMLVARSLQQVQH